MVSRFLILVALLSAANAGRIHTDPGFRRPPRSRFGKRSSISPSPMPTFIPSPSLSTLPTIPPQSSPIAPPPCRCPPQIQKSPAPTDAVGPFLGTVGLETEEFRKSRRQLRHVVKILNNCGTCRLEKSLNPPNTGRCKFGSPLGFSKTPSGCFFERCHQMLLAKGPCMCLVRI